MDLEGNYVDALDPERLIQCPYDKYHQIRACRFPYHLIKCRKISPNEIERFSDFPLSNKTLKGLQEAQYRMVTEIQRQTIGLSLQGKDVLGAAKTGSGKTLAFIIPASN
nr:probable ATP-dependent RNA helicase DDX10 [Caretta caretta]